MKRYIGLGLILSFLICFITPIWADDPLNLHQQFRVNDDYNTKTMIDYKIHMKSSGINIDMNVKVDMGIGNKVVEMDSGGNARVKQTIHSIYAQIDAPFGISMNYDSANPLANPVSYFSTQDSWNEVSVLIGLSYYYRMSPAGDVLEFQGVDAAIDKLLSKMSDGPDKDKLKDKLLSQLNLNGDSDIMNGFKYPSKPIRIGDTWQDTDNTVANGIPIIMKTKYKLVERHNGIAVVETNATLQTKNSPLIPYKMSGTQTGTMEIQESTGWVIRAKLQQKFSGSTKDKNGQSIPMTMDGSINSEPMES